MIGITRSGSQSEYSSWRSPAVAFALTKIGLTCIGVLLLTQLSRVRTFGRIPVGAILYSVLVIYGTLIFYEFRLLDYL